MSPLAAARIRWVRGGKRWLLSRDFAWLWSGLSVSTFGSYLTSIGLGTLAVLTLHASPLQMGALVALEAAPTLVLGLVAGVWVDRLRRRPLMIAADLARATLLLIVPLGAVLHRLDWGVLVAVAVAVGLLSVIFDLAQGAYLPVLLPDEQLVAANSRLSASRALAEAGGPALAGGMIQVLTPVGAMAGDALSYLVSALCLGRVHHREPPPQASTGTFWRDLRAGWRVLWGDATIRSLTLAAVTRSFSGGAFAALYSLYLLRELRLAPLVLGLCISAGGVGALGGALLAPALARRWSVERLIGGAALVAGGCALLTPLAGGALLLVASQGFGDAAAALYEICGARLVASAVPPATLGRVLGASRLLAQAALPLGAVLAALASVHLGLRLTLGLGSVGLILASLWLFSLPGEPRGTR